MSTVGKFRLLLRGKQTTLQTPVASTVYHYSERKRIPPPVAARPAIDMYGELTDDGITNADILANSMEGMEEWLSPRIMNIEERNYCENAYTYMLDTEVTPRAAFRKIGAGMKRTYCRDRLIEVVYQFMIIVAEQRKGCGLWKTMRPSMNDYYTAIGRVVAVPAVAVADEVDISGDEEIANDVSGYAANQFPYPVPQPAPYADTPSPQGIRDPRFRTTRRGR